MSVEPVIAQGEEIFTCRGRVMRKMPPVDEFDRCAKPLVSSKVICYIPPRAGQHTGLGFAVVAELVDAQR
jgi:hypothetical protein